MKININYKAPPEEKSSGISSEEVVGLKFLSVSLRYIFFWITASFWSVPDAKMADIGAQDKMSHVSVIPGLSVI